jgi:hypothetical protein
MLKLLMRLLWAGGEMEDEAGVESQLLDEGLGEGLVMDLGRSLCMLDQWKDSAILASSPEPGGLSFLEKPGVKKAREGLVPMPEPVADPIR